MTLYPKHWMFPGSKHSNDVYMATFENLYRYIQNILKLVLEVDTKPFLSVTLRGIAWAWVWSNFY